MRVDKDKALVAAVTWLLTLREKARSELAVANILLDTQPDGMSLHTLAGVLNDPSLLTDDEKMCIRNHQKIPHAVKLIRDRVKCSLMEAKHIADAWERTEQEAGRLPSSYKPWEGKPPVATPPPLPVVDIDIDLDEIKAPPFGHDSPTPFDTGSPAARFIAETEDAESDLASMSPGDSGSDTSPCPGPRTPRAFD